MHAFDSITMPVDTIVWIPNKVYVCVWVSIQWYIDEQQNILEERTFSGVSNLTYDQGYSLNPIPAPPHHS